MSTDFRGISSQAASRLLRYSTILLTTAPLRLCSAVFVHVQDSLLFEEDEQLPLAGHIVRALKHLYFVEDFIFVVFMGAQEVIISNPESQIIVGTVDIVEAVCVSVRGLIGPIQAFDHLLERSIFSRNSIVVGKPNDLSDLKGEIFAKFLTNSIAARG